MNDDHQMTRREYREEQERASSRNSDENPHTNRDAQFENSGNNMDESSLIFSKHQNHDRNERFDEDPHDDVVSRHDILQEDKATLLNEKTQHLKIKLNKIIIGLIVAIILVYLFLFFVG